MKKYLGIVLVLAVVIIAVIISRDGTTANVSALKMGVISPLTGDFAAVGENIVKGIKTAQSVYEAKTNTKVELLIEDDGGDGAKGLSAYKKLTELENIDSLINVFTTTMDTIYGQTKQAGYPVMMVAFQANNVADDHVFQTTPGNDGTWNKYAAYIKKLGYDDSKFVLVHSKDAAQESFAKSFASFYQGKTTSYVTSSDKNSLRADAAKIAALKPTMILFMMTPENGAILTKEILPLLSTSTKLFYDVQLYTGLSFYKEQLGTDLSRINGAMNINLEGMPNKEFTDAYSKLYPNEEPGFLADFGYDTFMVYVQSYDKDNAKWIANLKSTDTSGPSGKMRFDAQGIREPDLLVKKVVNGKLEAAERLPF